MSVTVVSASDAHLQDLAENLRPFDRREVQALGFVNPLDGIRTSAAASLWVKAAVDEDGRVVAVWGLGDCGDGVGGPWMLSTRAIIHHRRDLLRLSRAELEGMRAEFPRLSCFVDDRYGGAKRWVRWLGFLDQGTVFFGPVPFLCFEQEGL
jgi:hypothetical protein